MKTEWWYESSLFELEQTLVFARLTVRDDGGADILTDSGEVVQFPGEDEAVAWLGDEEYYAFDHLLERLQQEKTQLDPRIKLPAGQRDHDLLPQMVIHLKNPMPTLPQQPPIPTAIAKMPVP